VLIGICVWFCISFPFFFTIAELIDFWRFLTLCHTVAHQFLQNVGKRLTPTRQWIHNILGMIQRTSGSGLIRISILDHSRFTFQPWQSFCSLNAFVLIMHICDCVDFCQYGSFWDDDDHHHHDYYYYHYLSEWPTYCMSIFIELLCYISVIFSLSSRISEVAADFMKKWYYSALSSLPLPSRTNIAHVMRIADIPLSRQLQKKPQQHERL